MEALTKIIRDQIVDYQQGNNIAARLRSKRFALFKDLVLSLHRPLSILDVGGTPQFWERMGLAEERGVRVVLLNVEEADIGDSIFTHVIGDARHMVEFADEEFDVVFSNSVIEHVGGYDQQREMAEEIRRVGKRYFLQTPNYFFPIEPHFFFPFFQFFPRSLKVFLIRHLSLGWYKKTPIKQEATKIADSIRLLTERELRTLFPESAIYKEKFFGLTKSFVVYSGWSKEINA